MSLNLNQKQQVVAQVSEAIGNAQTVVIARYAGVTVESLTTIRAQAREAGVYFHVVKNTLAKIAIKGSKFEALSEHMSGQIIYSISEDPVAAAKVIDDFAKAEKKVEIVAGMYNEDFLDVDGVKKLASTPSREELLAMVMGVMQQVPASFVRLVAALKDKKEQEAA